MSTKGQGQFSLSGEQIKNIRLAYDSLDECLELLDSLQVQISYADSTISADSLNEINLRAQISKSEQVNALTEIQLSQEKQVSAAYRKKYRLWKILSFVFGGLTVYQIVK